jgi:hypothetical protein
MRTVETTATVTPDHTVTVRVPDDIPAGACRVVLVIDAAPPAPTGQYPFGIKPHDVGLVDPNFTFRREDLYGDDGR